MRANEFITENSGKFKFLRPGELRGSYTDSQLRALGFRQSQSGTWFIALDKWNELVRTKQISESHNPRVFRRGFESQKDFGKYKLVAAPGRFLLHQKFNEPSDQFTISVFHRGHKVGWVNFEIVDDNLEALDLYVEPKHRRRGLATAMYKFAVELGNDVKPSSKQTALGRAFWATKDPTTESYDDENTDLPSVEQAKSAIPQILQAAQRVYNDWDEEDRDTYAGGGICHIIADAVCDVLYSAGIECTPVSCDYEQHVYVAAKFEEGIYTIDIPYHIYETGGGFSWKKIPDVVFEKNDVVFYRASGDPNDWENYINETTEDKKYFEAKRRRKKIRRRIYAPIMYGWYGFTAGDSEGGDGGGLEESLDQPYNLIDWDQKDFGFPIKTWAALPDGTNLEIQFSQENPLVNDWEVEFDRGGSLAKTGQGLASRIFATVLAAIRQFVHKQKPNEIRFSALKDQDETGSRQRLYLALAKRYAVGMGYSFNVNDDGLHQVYIFKKIKKDVAEAADNKNPQWLYHATYRPLLKSIKAHGLGGDRAQAKWEDSKPGVVYLALDPNVAESYAESSDVVPEDWLDQIVILKIAASKLDKSRLFVDQNVQDNEGDTLEYHGVIPLSNISLYKKGVAENFTDGRNPGDKGDSKRYNVPTKGKISTLRKIAKQGGRRGQLAHWMANMRSGKQKDKK